MKLFELNKIVFSVRNNADKFLNGLTSNTLEAPNNAFLNIQGKVVATFDQVKIGDDEYLILIEESFVGNTSAHIDRYLKLSKTSFDKTDYRVYFDLDGGYSLDENEYAVSQKKGKLVITKKTLDSNVSENEFTLFRLKNNIPVHGIDFRDEMLLNISTDEFVSFTKGCFLGQEPISKVYNRSKPSWKLVVKREDECDGTERGEMTSKATDPDSKKTIGFVFAKNT